MRNVGVGFFVAAYAVLSLASSPMLAFPWGHLHFDPLMLPVAIAGITLALIPVRRGERWALLTQVFVLGSALQIGYSSIGTRFILDKVDHVVPNPSQPTHLTLNIALALAIGGLMLCSGPFHRASNQSSARV